MQVEPLRTLLIQPAHPQHHNPCQVLSHYLQHSLFHLGCRWDSVSFCAVMHAMCARSISSIPAVSNGTEILRYHSKVCKFASVVFCLTDFISLCPESADAPCAVCGGPLNADVKMLPSGFPCLRCGAVFHAGDRLIAHSTEHTGLKAHSCTICRHSFSRIDRLREHYRKNHAELIGANSEELHLVKPHARTPRQRTR